MTGRAFAAGALRAGYVLGTTLVAVGTTVSVSHVCIPSMLYKALRRARAGLNPGWAAARPPK